VRYDQRAFANRLALGLALTLLLCAGSVLAQGATVPSASDRAAAESLVNRSLELLEAGNPAEACPKLEESQRLDPGVGTLLYLADCYQQMGLTASAWGTFREAAYLAKSEGQADREQIAVEHADALEQKLSYLTLEVTDAPGGTPEVKHNGEVVGKARWGARFPVDPGSHAVEASAPGRKPWSSTLKIPEGPGLHRLVIPVLEASAVEPAEPSVELVAPSPPTVDAGSGQQTLGWVLAGVGSAAVVTGGIFALLARGDDADANASCRPDRRDLCNATGVDLADGARTKANIAGISAGVGLAALGAGITLLVLAPGDDGETARLGARALAGGGLFSLEAAF
jgi:hypothetical protein